MTKIYVYDVEAERIEELCNKLEVTEAQIVEALFNILDEMNCGQNVFDADTIAEYI